MARSSAAALLLVVVLSPLSAWAEPSSRADPFALLQRIREVFLEGNYEQVEPTATELLEGSPSVLVRASALQYLGAALELLGRSEDAEEQFEILLTLQPEFQMNRADFPTEVISLFESVRLRVQDRFNQIAEQRRRQQDAARRARERQLLDQQRRLLEMARPRYIIRDRERRNLLVALLPFGAGQFQNGHERRGWAFFGVEIGLTLASQALWLSGTLLPEDAADTEQVRGIQRGLQIASYSVFGTLVVAVAWGIIDALINYRRLGASQERWREVDERSVPEEYHVDIDPELLQLDAVLGTGGQSPSEGTALPTSTAEGGQ